LQNETAAFRLWMVIKWSPCDEDFDSPSTRCQASIGSRHGYLHPELLQLLTPDFFTLACEIFALEIGCAPYGSLA